MHLLAFFVMGTGNLLGVLVAPRERRFGLRSVAALVLGTASVLAPLCLSREWPIVRTVMAFGFAAGYLRVVQVVRRPAGTTLDRRALSVIFLLIDPRFVRQPSVLRLGAFVVGAYEFGLAVLLFLAPYPQTGALRTLVGAASAYFVVEGSARMAEALLAVTGVDTKPLHDAPIRSRTVGEFWSKRWNRAIHGWLAEHTFRPTAVRMGAAAGVMAAFGVSALLHAIPIWVAFDLRHALVMGGFFLLHGVIVVVESKLRVTRWPHILGHVWTLGIFALTASLFVEPLLASLGR